MRFKGQLRLPDEDGGIPVELLLDDIFLLLLSEGEELGSWRVDDVDISRIFSNQFRLDLDGETMVFIADDALGFAYEGLAHVEEITGRLRKKRRFRKSKSKERRVASGSEDTSSMEEVAGPLEEGPVEPSPVAEPEPAPASRFAAAVAEAQAAQSLSETSPPAPPVPSPERVVASEPAPAPAPEPVAASVPAPEPEPAPAPAPEPVAASVPAPEPEPAPAPEPPTPQAPLVIEEVTFTGTSAAEEAYKPVPPPPEIPVVEALYPTPAFETVDAPAGVGEDSLVEPAPAPEPVVASEPVPAPAPEPLVVSVPAPEPEPAPAPAPEPVVVSVPAPEPEPAPEPVASAPVDEPGEEGEVDAERERSGAHLNGRDAERRRGFLRRRDRTEPPVHDHVYENHKTVGGITRRVCTECGHVSFSSEDVYESWK